uniref:Uncharacterized protein n=1 Tax=Vitrella brassicaformis TaxID=1169539 RepID=A0A7S1NZ21_9ALVE|mmetsp:Transcript_16706/g.40094  ORF Transcript_16706/g.40094 Transcript_16706/m.40094 type:complete len:216 (+) Transcript_16706:37-684(+)
MALSISGKAAGRPKAQQSKGKAKAATKGQQPSAPTRKKKPPQVAEEPQPTAVSESPGPPAQSCDASESAPPEKGAVTVKFLHYTKPFDIDRGRLAMSRLDEEFGIRLAFGENAAITMEDGQGQQVEKSQDGESDWFEGLEANGTYVLQVEEDPAQADRPSKTYEAPSVETCPLKKSAKVADITRELQGMSVEEIREKGDKYKELVEARDLEDTLS